MESKYIHTLSIGGEERKLKIKLVDVYWFFDKYNKLLIKYKNRYDDPKYTQEVNSALNNVVYKSLISTGFLFWKKPFRSRRQMVLSILKEEYPAYSAFIADNILNDITKKKKNQPIGAKRNKTVKK